MGNNNLEANKCDYDFQNDSVFFYKETDNDYEFSVDFDGIILDFDDKNDVTGIEILDASEKFSFSKRDLLKINEFNAMIDINTENVKVEMKLGVTKRNKLINRCLDALTLNSMGLPTKTQGMAITF